MAIIWIQCLACFLLAHAFGSELTCPTLFNYYPDQHDCTKFYRCVWGKATLFNCPAGTRWSQEILTCDHSAKVSCTKQPATKIVYDKYSGNYKETYDPERKVPDFSVDYSKKDDHTTTYPDNGHKKHPEPEPYYPDYKPYPKEKETITKKPYYPDYETYPKNKNDYTDDYSTNYRPREDYGNVDYRRFDPNLGYYYTTYYPPSNYPYNYRTSTNYYKGYPDLSYNPYFKVNFDGLYTPQDPSVGNAKDLYYEQQYKPTPSWYPYNYAYHQSRYYPNTYYEEKYEQRPQQGNEQWPSSDLFRAGYGYKRIYVKK